MNLYLDRLNSLVQRLSLALAVCGAVSVALLVLIISYGVFMRFFVGQPQSWTDQFSEYCLVWIVFFGLAYTLVENGHVRMELIVSNVGDRLANSMQVVAHLVGFVFSIGLFFGTLDNFAVFWGRNTIAMSGLPVPLWLPATPMLLGTLCLSLVMLVRLLEYAIGRSATGLSTEEEAF